MKHEFERRRLFLGGGPVWHSTWPPGRVEPNRRIYDYELVYFANGSGRIITGERVYECSTGSAIIIPPGLVHCTVGVTQLERWCIHFDWFGDCGAHRDNPKAEDVFVYNDDPAPYREELAAKDPELPGVSFPVFRETVPQEILLFLRRYFLPESKGVGGMLMRQGVLMQILGLVLRGEEPEAAQTPESGKLFFKAKNLIDARYLDGGLRVAGVAAEFQITANHLTKLFHAALGMSVMDYIQTRRVDYSRKLLLESNLTVREVAFASGFNDPNYFTRFFQQKTGMTPSRFRREWEIRFDGNEA